MQRRILRGIFNTRDFDEALCKKKIFKGLQNKALLVKFSIKRGTTSKGFLYTGYLPDVFKMGNDFNRS